MVRCCNQLRYIENNLVAVVGLVTAYDVGNYDYHVPRIGSITFGMSLQPCFEEQYIDQVSGTCLPDYKDMNAGESRYSYDFKNR